MQRTVFFLLIFTSIPARTDVAGLYVLLPCFMFTGDLISCPVGNKGCMKAEKCEVLKEKKHISLAISDTYCSSYGILWLITRACCLMCLLVCYWRFHHRPYLCGKTWHQRRRLRQLCTAPWTDMTSKYYGQNTFYIKDQNSCVELSHRHRQRIPWKN